MGFKVVLTPQSLDDLEEIVTFIAKDNPERARTFGNELIDRALSVGAFPELGRMVAEIGEPAVREIIHGSYRIIYELFPTRKQFMCCASGTEREGSRKSKPRKSKPRRDFSQTCVRGNFYAKARRRKHVLPHVNATLAHIFTETASDSHFSFPHPHRPSS